MEQEAFTSFCQSLFVTSLFPVRVHMLLSAPRFPPLAQLPLKDTMHSFQEIIPQNPIVSQTKPNVGVDVISFAIYYCKSPQC